MGSSLVIYRTCDRPEYTEQSFPALLERTSFDSNIVVIENSKDSKNASRNTSFIQGMKDPRVHMESYGRRIGINKAVIEGIKLRKKFPKKEFVYILIADDDVLVPEPMTHTWDEALVGMLEEGKWNFAGLYGKDMTFPEPGNNYPVRFMSGACSAFRLQTYLKKPLKTGIFSYNQWSSKIGKCGRYFTEPMYYLNMDKDYSLGMSLRNTTYKEYSSDIDKQRWPNGKKTK